MKFPRAYSPKSPAIAELSDVRRSRSNAERERLFAKELVSLQPNVILAHYGPQPRTSFAAVHESAMADVDQARGSKRVTCASRLHGPLIPSRTIARRETSKRSLNVRRLHLQRLRVI